MLAYCAKGLWQKQDGKPKFISAAFVAKSRLARAAERCPEYESDDDGD